VEPRWRERWEDTEKELQRRLYKFEEVSELAEMGIKTDAKQMHFSGFASQGDGASFTGTIDVPKFMLSQNMVGEYLEDYAEAVSPESEVCARLVKRRGERYSHNMTVAIESEGLSRECEAEILGLCRDLMLSFYRDLGREYQTNQYRRRVMRTIGCLMRMGGWNEHCRR
jgi:hypothetical protein